MMQQQGQGGQRPTRATS